MEQGDLYGLPLERFIAERNALVRELRKAGQRDEAEAVSKLRRPSVAAWAVNQLIRTQSRDVAALFTAGDALQQAQADLLAGRSDPGSLRQAVEGERKAVDRLAGRARGLLTSDGHELGAAKLEQISETLHAAALDEDARAQVRDGRLERELRHIGLGALGAGAGAPAGRAPARERGAGKQRPDRPKRPGSAKELKGKVTAARRTEGEARRRLQRAERELSSAEERRSRAELDLRAAEEALADVREACRAARREHEQAERALDALK